MYLGAVTRRVFKSSDGGVDWRDLNVSFKDLSEDRVTALAVNPHAAELRSTRVPILGSSSAATEARAGATTRVATFWRGASTTSPSIRADARYTSAAEPACSR